MTYKRSELVEDFSSVVLIFFDHSFVSLGQIKTGISPGIANKKGTLLWDNQAVISPSFCFRCSRFNLYSLILLLKLSWSLFLAKIYNREV